MPATGYELYLAQKYMPPAGWKKPRPVAKCGKESEDGSYECSRLPKHEGFCSWDICPSEFDDTYGCELKRGHEGEHTVTVEW